MYFLMTLSIKNGGYVFLIRLRNLRKNKDIVITKPKKGNGVVILDQKLYDNAIQGIISDTSIFEKLNEDPTLIRQASLQLF